MEHLLCTICDPPRRHPRSEPHKFTDGPIMVADQTPIAAKVKTRVVARVPFKIEPSEKIEAKVPSECPVCAARREKWKAAAARHRAKKGKRA